MLFEKNVPYAVITALLNIIGTLGMMCSTTRFKYGTKRVLTVLFLYLCYAAAVTTAINILFGYLVFLRTALLTISAPAIYLIYRLADDQPSKAVFNYATQLLISEYISAGITIIITMTQASALTACIIRITVHSIVIFLEYRFIRRSFLHIFSVAEKGWLILALIPCSLMILAMSLASYPVHFTESSTGTLFVCLLGAVIVIIYFAIFQFLFMQYRFQTARHDMEIMKIQNENLKEKMARDTKATEQSRIDRHDMRHKFQTIASLLESGQTSEALDYISRSVSQLPPHQSSVTYCEDVLLNATLSSYIGQAKIAGIAIKTRLSLPDILPVDSGEFSIVIANAMENAIKACALLPMEERRIILKCIYKPKLMLEISNPCRNEVVFSKNGFPLSKEEGHGIGCRSIMTFCRKYDALCSFSMENKMFTLKIVL